MKGDEGVKKKEFSVRENEDEKNAKQGKKGAEGKEKCFKIIKNRNQYFFFTKALANTSCTFKS